MTDKWQFEMQGPLKDWPSVVRADGTLLARTYGPLAEDAARIIASAPDTAKAARAMLAALKGQITMLEHYASRLRSVHAIVAREMEMDIARLRSQVAQAEAAGIKTEE